MPSRICISLSVPRYDGDTQAFYSGSVDFYVSEHAYKYISVSVLIEWYMIVVTVFLLIMKLTESRLVHNKIESYLYDHNPFKLKRNKMSTNFTEYVHCTVYTEINTYLNLSCKIPKQKKISLSL